MRQTVNREQFSELYGALHIIAPSEPTWTYIVIQTEIYRARRHMRLLEPGGSGSVDCTCTVTVAFFQSLAVNLNAELEYLGAASPGSEMGSVMCFNV